MSGKLRMGGLLVALGFGTYALLGILNLDSATDLSPFTLVGGVLVAIGIMLATSQPGYPKAARGLVLAFIVLAIAAGRYAATLEVDTANKEAWASGLRSIIYAAGAQSIFLTLGAGIALSVRGRFPVRAVAVLALAGNVAAIVMMLGTVDGVVDGTLADGDLRSSLVTAIALDNLTVLPAVLYAIVPPRPRGEHGELLDRAAASDAPLQLLEAVPVSPGVMRVHRPTITTTDPAAGMTGPAWEAMTTSVRAPNRPGGAATVVQLRSPPCPRCQAPVLRAPGVPPGCKSCGYR